MLSSVQSKGTLQRPQDRYIAELSKEFDTFSRHSLLLQRTKEEVEKTLYDEHQLHDGAGLLLYHDVP